MQGTKSKLGRPRIPLRWTRVFEVKPQVMIDVELFGLQLDHVIFEEHYQVDESSTNRRWKLLFDPSTFKDQTEELKCDDY